MKGRAITLPKREANPLCEDASCLRPGHLLAVSDGAGGGGLYADLWAQYLIQHLPTQKGFADADALDCWLGAIWEAFYNDCELRAKKSGSFYLNKFYDEGSFATLAALWRVSARSYYWVAYGDSVAFHYSRRLGRLTHSFGRLQDFALPPYLINCKDELRREGFHSGYFFTEPGDYVFVTSDALAQYIVMMSLLTHRGEHHEEISQLLGAGLRQSNYLRHALELPTPHLWSEVLRPLLLSATTPRHFARYIDTLLRQGILAPDDYSIVRSKC